MNSTRQADGNGTTDPPPPYAEYSQTNSITGFRPKPTTPQHNTIIVPSEQVIPPDDTPNRRFPIGSVFFLLGWFCPPFWFIGACCCVGSSSQYENWWGKLNLILAIAVVVITILYSFIHWPIGHL
ncbi:hypothetical protein BC941DRAFT_433511 [Chlamydoabsidia padenii]|nr:hypothetical protein BC941DRAFT_433511 [Chlamydoabsidia padenii]